MRAKFVVQFGEYAKKNIRGRQHIWFSRGTGSANTWDFPLYFIHWFKIFSWRISLIRSHLVSSTLQKNCRTIRSALTHSSSTPSSDHHVLFRWRLSALLFAAHFASARLGSALRAALHQKYQPHLPVAHRIALLHVTISVPTFHVQILHRLAWHNRGAHPAVFLSLRCPLMDPPTHQEPSMTAPVAVLKAVAEDGVSLKPTSQRDAVSVWTSPKMSPTSWDLVDAEGR